MTERFYPIRAEGIEVVVDLANGHLRSVEIERDGRTLTPFYTAPWVNEPDVAADESISPGLRFLSCDFFCSPFSRSDDPEIPLHGWPANSAWDHLDTRAHPSGGMVGRFVLLKRVQGARLVKEITLRDGHPFVYQRHVFEGGHGPVTAASHAMTQFATRGRLSFSPKAYGEAPPDPQESDPARGRSALAYPSHFDDLTEVPLKDGGTTSLRSYPIAARHEDFLMLVEAEGSALGWAAALREQERDIVLSLKNPSDYPITMLWFSNGGRDYRPWNGRNVGVLGMEEGRVWSAHGYKASVAPNPLSGSGVTTSLLLKPDSSVELRHVIGGFPLPEGWGGVQAVESSGDGLSVRGDRGEAVTLPFDPAFLAAGG